MRPRICSYIWSDTVIPRDSVPSTDARRVASFPASVVIGKAVQTATMMVTTSSIPSHRGWATTEANVSFGAVMMPRNRAGKLRGGATPGETDVLDIEIEGTGRIVM